MTAKQASPYQFEVITDKTAFLRLKHEWVKLHQDNIFPHNIFLTYDWNLVWYETFFESHSVTKPKLQIILIRENDKPVFLFPLLSRQKFGLKELRWVGDPVSQYGSVLFNKDSDLQKIIPQALSFIKEKFEIDLLILPAILEGSALSNALKSEQLIQYDFHKSLLIDLSDFESGESYWKKRSSSGARQRRRLRRKLIKEHGELSFTILKGSDEDAEKYIRQALSLKEKSLQQKHIYSTAFATGKMEDFFANLAQNNYENLLVSVLSCRGEAIAIELGLEQGDYYISHLGVYDMNYRKYGPGKLQIENTVNTLYQQGIRIVDLLPPADPYKITITNKEEDVTDFALPFSLKGELYLTAILKNLRPLAKKVKNNLQNQRMPHGLKKLLTKVSGQKKERD